MPVTVQKDGRAVIVDLRTAFDMMSDDIDPSDLIDRVDAGEFVPVTLRKGGAAIISLPGQISSELQQPTLALGYEPSPRRRFQIQGRLMFPIEAMISVDASDPQSAVRIANEVFEGNASVIETDFELDTDMASILQQVSDAVDRLQNGTVEALGIDHIMVDRITEIAPAASRDGG